MTFEHKTELEATYALQLVLDSASLALGFPNKYRMPDALGDYIQEALAATANGEWSEEDAQQLLNNIELALDTLAETIWASVGEDPRGWEKPCNHPECVAHRDQLEAAEGAGDAALEDFLKEMGLE